MAIARGALDEGWLGVTAKYALLRYNEWFFFVGHRLDVEAL